MVTHSPNWESVNSKKNKQNKQIKEMESLGMSMQSELDAGSQMSCKATTG